ncbi:hypothetical protein AAIH25_17450 [Arthrobacter crystallopoietes]|uniref:hypothetical protein n=1 Tax=Crystallibacter crystallopoietes TaxID=37928 RepID=UPI003D24D79C
MSTSLITEASTASLDEFDRTTSRWGRLTMIAGLIISLAGPMYLVVFGNLDVATSQLWTAFAAVAGTFFVIWLVEPLTYFPILGPAAMYQAFMIGNISNKLLPSALVAQTNIGAKPGTKRGDLAAVMAICGAAAVHLTSLLVFVGLLGTWLISVIPEDLIAVARLYVLPAVMGAVIVQAIVSMKQLRPTLTAFGVVLVVQFVLLPLVPGLTMMSTALSVIGTIFIAWFARKRTSAVVA